MSARERDEPEPDQGAGTEPPARDRHHDLNNPVGEPDASEWPDPYERREDPRDPPDADGEPVGDQPHPQTGTRSTSEPHPSEDPEAGQWEAPERETLDE